MEKLAPLLTKYDALLEYYMASTAYEKIRQEEPSVMHASSAYWARLDEALGRMLQAKKACENVLYKITPTE